MDYSVLREKGKMFEDTRIVRILFSHRYIAFFYGIFLFLYELSITREMISLLHPILILWSGMIIVYDVLIRRIWEKIPGAKVFFFFILSISVTVCFTAKAGMINNLKAWLLVLLPVLVVYPVCFCEKEGRQKNYIIAFFGAYVVTFFASLISVYMFFIRFGKTITFLGQEVFVGIYSVENEGVENYIILQGLYVDSGHAATYAMISVIFSCILLSVCRKYRLKKRVWSYLGILFCTLNIVVQFCYFVLANSRGGWLSLLFGIFVGMFLFIFFCRKGKSGGIIRFFAALLAAIFIVGILGIVLINIRNTMSSISLAHAAKEERAEGILESGNQKKEDTSKAGNQKKEEGASKVENQKKEDTSKSENQKSEKKDTGNTSENKTNSGMSIPKEIVQNEKKTDSFERPKESGDSLGSGRLAIWKEAVRLFEKRPVFGGGAGNNAYYAKLYDVGERLKNGKAIHNSYLDLLVDYGIVGFIALMIFYISCARKILLKLIRDGKNCDKSFFFALTGIVITMSASFFLSCCFVNITAMYFSNLLLVGYLVSGSIMTDSMGTKGKEIG